MTLQNPRARLTVFVTALFAFSVSPVFAGPQLWQEPYADGGDNTIALWHFDGNAPGRDAAGRGHDAALRGKDSHFVPDGKFGGALEVDDNLEPGDTRQGAATPNKADLNPNGAFTLELWMSPDERLAKSAYAFLLDKKYYNYASDKPAANTGYLLALRKAGGWFSIQAQLGFGQDSAIIDSEPQPLEAGQWYHVAFTYDGSGGASIYLNGRRIGHEQLDGRGAVAPSAYALVIGDRVGSSGQRFYGRIDEVRISNVAIGFATGKVVLETTEGRTAFHRMEKNAGLTLSVFNDTLGPLQNDVLQILAPGELRRRVALPEVAPGKTAVISVPIDTRLHPDTYHIAATVQNAAGQELGDALPLALTIVPRPLPNQMPVVMWAGATNDYKQLTDIGYTGELVGMADEALILKNGDSGPAMGQNQTQAMRRTLDDMLAARVDGLATLTPGRVAATLMPQFNRKDSFGKVLDNTDGLYPEVQRFCYDTGAAVARTFGDMPGWTGALIHSEVRDGSAPSFNNIDKKTYRDFSGQDIPSRVASARGVPYESLPGFPTDRVVADDDPILKYYRWYWKQGDGWNGLNSQVNAGLHSTGRNDLFTWYDPAVRAPSIYGSGGDVGYLNQWTYTYPNPLKVGLATDELFGMARGRPGQKVMNMIQIIWYRSQTTKTPEAGQEAAWEKVSPDAKFISIAPDHLSEGMWLELSRPISAIANHGWGSLGDRLGFSQGSYVTTNIDTRKRMTAMLQNVVKPLAPMLLQVPDAPAHVAFLESFASQMFAGRGTYGWGGGWGADSYLIARYAGLQPQIVYDETIQQKGLDQYNVLFLTDCDVLPHSVAEAIEKFQQRGGIVIGDQNLAPAIQPDILLSDVKEGPPDATKAALLQEAAELRRELNPFYQSPVQSSNPEVIVRRRVFGNSDYIFATNDRRTYGDYVGQYHLVMEKGLPSQANIMLRRKSGFVYDLMRHRLVPCERAGNAMIFPVRLDGGQGDLFLVTERPAGRLQLRVPATAARGAAASIEVRLNDAAGQPLGAVVPLQVTVRDARGRVAEGSGYYGAANGLLRLTLDIAPNDALGKWQVEVQEGLTGQIKRGSFMVVK